MYRLGASVCVVKCERLEALNSVHIQSHCPYTRCKYMTSFKQSTLIENCLLGSFRVWDIQEGLKSV